MKTFCSLCPLISIKVNKMKKCIGGLLLHFPQGVIWEKNGIKIGEFFFKSKFWCGFLSSPILKTVTDTCRDIREGLVINYCLQRIKKTNSFMSSTMNTSSRKLRKNCLAQKYLQSMGLPLSHNPMHHITLLVTQNETNGGLCTTVFFF